MEVDYTVQPYEEEWRVYQAKISTKTNKNDLSAGVFRSRLEQENSHYWMFCLLCFVFYGKIYIRNGWLCSFLLP